MTANNANTAQDTDRLISDADIELHLRRASILLSLAVPEGAKAATFADVRGLRLPNQDLLLAALVQATQAQAMATHRVALALEEQMKPLDMVEGTDDRD